MKQRPKSLVISSITQGVNLQQLSICERYKEKDMAESVNPYYRKSDTPAEPAVSEVATAAVPTEKEVVSSVEQQARVIHTHEKQDGQIKCPKCGATDISQNKNTGKLRCNFCRHEFEPEKADGLVDDISTLEGMVIGAGAQKIESESEDIITLKCHSCGAEVVIDTAESLQARCHWCRNTLSLNQQIPNGAVPDLVLPFGITKEVAEGEVRKFVEKRSFFANPKFKAEFTTENIFGVYLPYMMIDANAHATFMGEGEHKTREYTVRVGDNKETRYDADLYQIEREFDIEVHDLTIESNKDKLDYSKSGTSNNIINSIMPFDTENVVAWNANYLKGFHSEKRDVDVSDLMGVAHEQLKDVTRFKANETLTHYDRGVSWKTEDLEVKGQQWVAAYLPVWLYSYQEKKSGGKNLLHYTAVNARTKETMGSVPIHMPKLITVSFIVELIALLLVLFVDSEWVYACLAAGPIYGWVMYSRYRNTDKRHTYELETRSDMSNVRTVDNFIKERKGLSNATMKGANNTRVSSAKVSFLDASD